MVNVVPDAIEMLSPVTVTPPPLPNSNLPEEAPANVDSATEPVKAADGAIVTEPPDCWILAVKAPVPSTPACPTTTDGE